MYYGCVKFPLCKWTELISDSRQAAARLVFGNFEAQARLNQRKAADRDKADIFWKRYFKRRDEEGEKIWAAREARQKAAAARKRRRTADRKRRAAKRRAMRDLKKSGTAAPKQRAARRAGAALSRTKTARRKKRSQEAISKPKIAKTWIVEDVSDARSATLGRRLTKWREQQSKASNVPAEMIFSRETLARIVKLRPTSLRRLSTIKGFNEAKTEKFGIEILELIKHWFSRVKGKLKRTTADGRRRRSK